MRTYYIKGQTVGLAEFLEDDYRLLYRTWQDPETRRNFNTHMKWDSYEAYLRFFTDPDRPPRRWMTTLIRLEDETPIGQISLAPAHLEPDLGIWIYRMFRGQGYGSEAVALAVDYIFEHIDVDFIVAGIFDFNPASRRVFEKAGFQRTPELDEPEPDAFGEGEVLQLGFRLEKDDGKVD